MKLIDEELGGTTPLDIILKFPERNYIIDAKVSLADWTKYVEAIKSNNVTYLKKADEQFDELNQSFNLAVSKTPALIAL